MTRKEIKQIISNYRENGDYCLCINGFYISLEEFCPICTDTTLYITDGINIEISDIKYIK